MPDYKEIVKQSQDNVKALGEKLKDLDKVHQDILLLKKKPEQSLRFLMRSFNRL